MIEFTELGLRFLTSLSLLVALIWVVGIVWRVEAELDTAYKWFTVAVVLLAVSEVYEVLPFFYSFSWSGVFFALLRFASSLALLLGMYYMRDLVRRMDGEKGENRK